MSIYFENVRPGLTRAKVQNRTYEILEDTDGEHWTISENEEGNQLRNERVANDGTAEFKILTWIKEYAKSEGKSL